MADALAELSLTATPSSSSNLPPPPKGRFPLAQEEYTGALLKIYDADAAFRPASAVEVIGIVSAAPLPAPFVGEDGTGEGDEVLVPAIHVLLQPTPAFPAEPSPTDVTGTRAALVTHLATAFEPADPVAAELLLLALIAHPTSRPGGLPLGTLALNLIRPATGATGALLPTLQELLPAVVPLDLTLPLLHSAAFRPSSDGTTLTPGTLQLAPDTLLLVDEDGLGTGGALAEKALRNVQALNDAIADQSLRYDYPYTDGVRIETALRAVLTSEGKSLLPADVHVPVTLASAPSASAEELTHLRAYLSAMGAPAHAEKLAVPDNVAQIIQDAFVEDRRASGSGSAEAVEERLRRRMKVARLMATSYPAAELTGEIWARTVALDAEVEARLKAREEKRREGRLGAPTEAAAVNGAVNGIAATEAAQ